ncbi:MAG TPA: hypothetical protein VF453_13515 [Burkholderiaceae bacterium]
MTSTTARRVLATALGALALATAAVPAQAHGGYGYGYHGGYHGGYHHGGYYHGGYYRGGWPFWAGVGLAVDVGLAGAYYYDRPYVVVDQPPVVYAPPAPVVVYPNAAPAPAVAPAQPDPIFYPRNGQSPQQTEADRRACNAWATTQPSAMADASVFQRATLACMDGRGYTGR